jgi:hypothetical protein
MKFIKSIFTAFTIWVLAAMLNALLSGSWVTFFSNEMYSWPGAFILVLIFTLIFSIPGMFIFWIVMLVNWNEELLFRTLLKAGFIISALSSLWLYLLDDFGINGQELFLSLGIVISAIASIMAHYRIFKMIYTNKISENYVSDNY